MNYSPYSELNLILSVEAMVIRRGTRLVQAPFLICAVICTNSSDASYKNGYVMVVRTKLRLGSQRGRFSGSPEVKLALGSK